jgi:hypothetical protein
MNFDMLDPKIIGLAVLVVVIIAVAGLMYMRKRRSATADLRKQFGPRV